MNIEKMLLLHTEFARICAMAKEKNVPISRLCRWRKEALDVWQEKVTDIGNFFHIDETVYAFAVNVLNDNPLFPGDELFSPLVSDVSRRLIVAEKQTAPSHVTMTDGGMFRLENLTWERLLPKVPAGFYLWEGVLPKNVNSLNDLELLYHGDKIFAYTQLPKKSHLKILNSVNGTQVYCDEFEICYNVGLCLWEVYMYYNNTYKFIGSYPSLHEAILQGRRICE